MELAQLPDQVPRIDRHCLPIPQEEASDLPPHLPPRSYRPSVLHSAYWVDCGAMGSHHHQPSRSRRDVLVLLPERPRRSHLVEEVHHHAADPPVRH